MFGRPAPGASTEQARSHMNCRAGSFRPRWAVPSPSISAASFGPTSSGGGVSAAGGGLALPSFTNWRAGLTFSYRVFKLGLNYTDTNLSKENCYVLTGDLGAVPGGVSNPGNNPFGLRSRLCGAAFSATLGVEIHTATP